MGNEIFIIFNAGVLTKNNTSSSGWGYLTLMKGLRFKSFACHYCDILIFWFILCGWMNIWHNVIILGGMGSKHGEHKTFIFGFILVQSFNFLTSCEDSSVGRASDWRSEGHVFDPCSSQCLKDFPFFLLI